MSRKIANIFVDDGGAGSLPVVFVHSLAGNTKQWSAQLEHLRPTRRAIALDLRGHGQSPPPANGEYAIDAMAQDIQAAVEALGIERFILVGHSMGASVAGAYAGVHPQRVAALLLADPSGDATQMPAGQVEGYLGALQSEAYSEVIEQYWNQILDGSAAKTEATVLQDLRHTPKETIVGVFQALFKYNPLPALQRYQGPRLSVITAQNEAPFSLHNLIPGLPYKKISGTGHWLQLDKPEEFNHTMDDFLALAGNGAAHE